MSYIPSVNIEQGLSDDFQYVVTSNSQTVWGSIISSFNDGLHSFSIVGNYGTGKSSFIAALQRDLLKGTNVLVQRKDVLGCSKFEFINIVGDYESLSTLLAKKLGIDTFATTEEVIEALNQKYNALKRQNKFLFIVVDECGKVLEHAAANNPEKELYFLQKLAEYVNAKHRNIILLTTLHQNFGTYSYKLNDAQRNEWMKIKGRLKELVFVEPIEQLLYLTASQLKKKIATPTDIAKENLRALYCLAKKNKIVSYDLALSTSMSLYPLDPISSTCLIHSMQRYGQNERTLFSFLMATDRYSISAFKVTDYQTYNLAEVYDYVVYNFYSFLSEANADSMDWRSMRLAIERVESGILADNLVDGALAIVKSIGLLNLFCKNVTIDNEFLTTYCKFALDIKNPERYIELLKSHKIIRYATYKSQYILFEGTDIDIESELYKAATIVPRPTLTVENVQDYVNANIMLAVKSYYTTGTPRYFQYHLSNTPITTDPQGDIDGFVNLVLPTNASFNDVMAASNEQSKAILYAYFLNTDEIISHLHEVFKLKYLLENVVLEDRVAANEVKNILNYEVELLNKALNESLFDGTSVFWCFQAKKISIRSQKDLNKQLSTIADTIYHKTPILRNELFNRHKVNSVISAARVNLLDAILANSDQEDLGFNKSAYPPEKSIYYTLLRETGIHHKDTDGQYVFGAPTCNVTELWDECCRFVQSSTDKPRKLSELIKTLKSAPFKLKQGVIDFWLPIFLYIKQQDFALYEGDRFVLSITKEVFEILQKHPNEFSIKSYNVSSVKADFFKKYRQFFHKDDTISIQGDSLIGVAKPFLQYIKNLNDYAKHTYKFDNYYTAKFRDILLGATDPSKTFLEDLPTAFGYNDLNKDEFLEQYLVLIKKACQELNNCFYNFVCRIENNVCHHLGLTSDFDEYKEFLEKRYKNINKDLLTPKSRSFLDRILASSDNKTEFYSKIGFVVFDKKIEFVKDSEEALFIKELLHLFSELDHFTSLSEIEIDSNDEAFSIDFVSNRGTSVSKQTYRLPQSKQTEAKSKASELNSLLTGDNEMDICILLSLLNDKMK